MIVPPVLNSLPLRQPTLLPVQLIHLQAPNIHLLVPPTGKSFLLSVMDSSTDFRNSPTSPAYSPTSPAYGGAAPNGGTAQQQNGPARPGWGNAGGYGTSPSWKS